jgi:hypothetical protein
MFPATETGNEATMHRLRLLLLLALVALLAVGCGADDQEAEPGEPPPATEPVEPGEPEEPTEPEEPRETATCENEEAGYRVEYPADWHANEGDVAPPCSFFDPEPFDVPEATEFFGAAISVSRQPVSAEQIAGEGIAMRILESEEIEVAGRPAYRLETEQTGEGLLDAGVRSYLVVVDLNGESMLIATYDLPDHDYERSREVVDEMAESLELTQ